MAEKNVDINLLATEDGQTKKNLQSIIDKLEKINTLSTFQLKSSDIDKISKAIETQSKNKKKADEDINALLIQRADLYKKLAIAERSGWEEAQRRLQSMISTNENGNMVDKLRLKNHEKHLENEKNMIKLVETEYKVKKKISDIDEKSKTTTSKQEVEISKQISKNVKEIVEALTTKSQTLKDMASHYKKLETESAQMDKRETAQIKELIKLDEERQALKSKQAQQTNKSLAEEQNMISKSAKQSASVFQEHFNNLEKQEKLTKDKLKAELEAYAINDKINAQHKETISLQKHKLDMMSEQVSGKDGYDKLNSKIAQFNSQLKNGKTLTNEQLRSLQLTKKQLDANNTSLDKSVNSLNKLATAYFLINSLRKSVGILKEDIQELRDLDQAVYNLGVVSKLSTSRIEELKYELLDMGSKFPVQAEEIAKAMDTIGRTGITFEDNLQAIDDVIKLAISSGSGLSETAGIIAKTMVSFSLAGERATEAVDAMHSVVLSSPLSLESLNSSLANSANAFATLLEFTNKSSRELEIYQEKLLRLDLAMTGGLAKIGVQASTAGTTIRMFISKLNANGFVKFCESLENGVRQANYNVTGNGRRECLKIAC